MSSTNNTNSGPYATKSELSGKANSSDLNNYLPLSGGAMTGTDIRRAVDNSYLTIYGGTDNSKGAHLFLGGNERTTEDAGQFSLTAIDNSNTYHLAGKPNGSLTWGGKQVVTSDDLSNYLPREDTGYKNINGEGKYLWCKFATITIRGSWLDYPICFEVDSRGRLKSTLQVLFHSADNSDPGLASFTSDNDTNFYIKKTATSTWELYCLYSEVWSKLTIYRVVNSFIGDHINIDTTLENLETEPTDVTQCVSNYLPLSGGAMTGEFIRKTNDNGRIGLISGTADGMGASITLCGKDHGLSGQFYLEASDGTGAHPALIGTPTGELTWDGKAIITDCSVPFHNAYPRCKYLGTSITDAQNTAIKNRTYDDLFIGDYWTINGVNWRIVAIDPYYNVGDTNFDKGNIIVMPDTVLYNAQMNATATTAGGYANSLMRTQNLNNARTIARNAFGSHLANHRILLANSVDGSGPNSWGWYDSDGVELPNEVQIYGTRVWGSALKGYDVGTQKQQFPLFAFTPALVNIRQNYWLQDVSSSAVSGAFANVHYDGGADANNASNSYGVRPSVTLSYI